MLKLELGAVKVTILTPFLLVYISTVVATGTDLSEITVVFQDCLGSRERRAGNRALTW